ncbi:MAG: HD-GYP domain-containing protein [Deltaproteobacteria bacterium]|jgi:HD-GYP domain-containing protein (c-di-GMP phosphodiesterase class II)|nr:HD-GYP domain-containing protein [Deltaproteobacteria bacterium]
MLKKISTRSLQVGMFVADVGRTWFNHPWKTKSRLLTERSEIEELINFGIDEVVIDTDKSVAPPKTTPKPKPAPVVSTAIRGPSQPVKTVKSVEPTVTMEMEFPKAIKAYSKALDTSKALVAACQLNKRIEVNEVQENVDELVESVSRNRDALTALIKLRHFDDYTFTHSLNVSVLSLSTGKTLGLTDAELKILGLGTMFHDLGKIRIPDKILNKPGKLTDEEFAVMRNHAALSADIITEQHLNVNDQVIQVARFHHERNDGSGYPDHLQGDQIPPLATICGLSDVYDALTSDRVYHKGMPPHEALKFIYGLRGTHFQPEWVERFVQSVGIYPPGTIVELNSGHWAVVIEVNNRSLLTPLVKVVADPNRQLYTRPKLVDLSKPAESQGWTISGVISSSEAGFDPSTYFNFQESS